MASERVEVQTPEVTNNFNALWVLAGELGLPVGNQLIADARSIIDAPNRTIFKRYVIGKGPGRWTQAQYRRAQKLVDAYEQQQVQEFDGEGGEVVETQVDSVVSVVEDAPDADVPAQEEDVSEPTPPVSSEIAGAAIRAVATTPQEDKPVTSPRKTVAKRTPARKLTPEEALQRQAESVKRVSFVADRLGISGFDLTDDAGAASATTTVRRVSDLVLEAGGQFGVRHQVLAMARQNSAVLEQFMNGASGEELARLLPKNQDLGSVLGQALSFIETHCDLSTDEWAMVAGEGFVHNTSFKRTLTSRMLRVMESRWRQSVVQRQSA